MQAETVRSVDFLLLNIIPYLKSLKLRVHQTEFEALIKNLEKIINNRHRLPHSKTDIINICKAIVAKKGKNSVLALDDFKQIEDFQKSIENCRPATKVAIATTTGWQKRNHQEEAIIADNVRLTRSKTCKRARSTEPELVTSLDQTASRITQLKSVPYNQHVSLNLRPWVKNSIVKDNKAASVMRDFNSLAALYKCMECSCTFFSSDPELFAEHLNSHKADDSQGHLDCAYCEDKILRNFDLVQHIQEHHKHDVYNCGSCFYRSASTINVHNHHRACHKDISAVVIFECTPSQRLEEDSMLKVLKSDLNLVRQVPLLFCAFCKETYYGLDAYNEHLRTHPRFDKRRSVCQKCKNRIHTRDLTSHFETCFNIGMHQCLYCRYGTNSEGVVKVHLAHQHASTLPFFCSRSSSVQADPKSVRSLQIRKFKTPNIALSIQNVDN